MQNKHIKFSTIFKWFFRLFLVLLYIYYTFFCQSSPIIENYKSNCIIIFFSSLVPDALSKIFKIQLSSTFDFFIQLFILMSLVLGRMYGVYSIIPWWDSFLHFLSGILIGFLALAQLKLSLGNDLFKRLPPSFVALYVIIFSIAGAGLWEIWEFVGDQLLGFDSQLNSLTDTMVDIIMGTLSGLFVGVLSYIHVRYNKFKFLKGFINGFIK